MNRFVPKLIGVSRLALKIVVGAREQGTGRDFWAILLFFTYL
jgi:hypothetical protein